MAFGVEFLSKLFKDEYETPEKDLSNEQIRDLVSRAIKGAYALRNYDLNKIQIPDAVYRDTLRGAQQYSGSKYDSIKDAIPHALAERLRNRDVETAGWFFSPTGADYYDLWDKALKVPNKQDMSNLWE